jgi:hypothetical protein
MVAEVAFDRPDGSVTSWLASQSLLKVPIANWASDNEFHSRNDKGQVPEKAKQMVICHHFLIGSEHELSERQSVGSRWNCSCAVEVHCNQGPDEEVSEENDHCNERQE